MTDTPTPRTPRADTPTPPAGLDADEQAAMRWLAANDLYAVTHIHESDDCDECVAARPYSREGGDDPE